MFYQLLVCSPLGKRDIDRYLGLLGERKGEINGTTHWDRSALDTRWSPIRLARMRLQSCLKLLVWSNNRPKRLPTVTI